jgi:hypothetical protein
VGWPVRAAVGRRAVAHVAANGDARHNRWLKRRPESTGREAL